MVDMKPGDGMRSVQGKFKEKYGVGLGFMSFFTKAVCVALQEFPAVNAYIDGNGPYIIIAVMFLLRYPPLAVWWFLLLEMPESLSMAEIEKEVVQLATRGRDGKLSIEEMTGGTFSITNGGVFGSMLSTPILNPPQSAILGMHNIVQRPAAINGEVVVRPYYVPAFYDHRIVDGKESVSFW